MSEEKIALLTELREIIKKEGKEDKLNQLSFRLQSLLEEELDVEPLNLPRFTIIKENSQNLTESPKYPLGAITLDKKGKIRKIGVLESFPYPEIALLREIYLCFILLHDLVDGKELIKNTFGGLEFMKDYNPAKNLQWNKIDKKWRNHTIYDEIFNEIYPPLLPKEDEDTDKK